MDRVGTPRSRICTDLFAIVPRVLEHSRNAKEPVVRLARLDRFDYCGSIDELAVVHDIPDASRVSNI